MIKTAGQVLSMPRQSTSNLLRLLADLGATPKQAMEALGLACENEAEPQQPKARTKLPQIVFRSGTPGNATMLVYRRAKHSNDRIKLGWCADMAEAQQRRAEWLVSEARCVPPQSIDQTMSTPVPTLRQFVETYLDSQDAKTARIHGNVLNLYVLSACGDQPLDLVTAQNVQVILENAAKDLSVTSLYDLQQVMSDVFAAGIAAGVVTSNVAIATVIPTPSQAALPIGDAVLVNGKDRAETVIQMAAAYPAATIATHKGLTAVLKRDKLMTIDGHLTPRGWALVYLLVLRGPEVTLSEIDKTGELAPPKSEWFDDRVLLGALPARSMDIFQRFGLAGLQRVKALLTEGTLRDIHGVLCAPKPHVVAVLAIMVRENGPIGFVAMKGNPTINKFVAMKGNPTINKDKLSAALVQLVADGIIEQQVDGRYVIIDLDDAKRLIGAVQS